MSNLSSNLCLSIKPSPNKTKEKLKKNKHSNSQIKSKDIPSIITELKPFYLNNLDNIEHSINFHKQALTPNNKTKNFCSENKLLLPSKSPELQNKKTLILDLDETLVHSSTSPFEKNDIILKVELDGVIYNIYVLVRPGAELFIKNMSKYFEIIIFTASISEYASPLLDILDKENNIKFRLYREHCFFINGVYIKELKKLNRNLKDVIIVDNSPIAYAFDSVNGLPIKSWYEDKKDSDLFNIQRLLEFLAKTDDVRKYIELFVESNEIKYEKAYNIINSLNNSIFKNENKKNPNVANYVSLYDFLNFSNNNINFNNKEIKKYMFEKKGLKKDESKIQNIANNKSNENKNINQKNYKNYIKFNKDQNNYQISFKNVMEKTTKINALFPLSLGIPNTIKNIDLINNKNKNVKSISANKEIEKIKFLKNKDKRTNVLEILKKNIFRQDFDNQKIKNNLNKKSNKFHLNIKTIGKLPKTNRFDNLNISSSIINQASFIPFNKLKRKNSMKNYNSLNNSHLKLNKSKSMDNFINYSNNMLYYPKTPKINSRIKNLEMIENNNNRVRIRILNLFEEIKSDKLKKLIPNYKVNRKKISLVKI